ncbi:aminotransferase class I/II-fold pyridoxal phosphate-dependent enzyme [Frisingicoccus sp.]|uniref:aminotransferase class I/II-fold pyridoxal phosphate-dependent enzyme n=1 Tax=Frisingicoccus sp. TaxID=1918627 RepID=UPI00262D16A4|nr:aminotransferase class I/II-fold pyridoxal phosphate-dependent enzyme [Frisingicoccus sp.]MDD6233079.1 aminotransferase class I/II-fold pyridoxal phosphate-dependent enzyme [Frisingicoccus sp.]MDY4834138.1 aminotransferase class I/II-fold pyridoxal phosphate-dependent enzyme [Frisingicoccus sp.]MDY4923490.1 aminotransferase class I/II-fold pyridoxal phosphate-dependent enzyme [Frisingicoccus sp.]
MRNPLAERTVGIKPSGIRKFFDLVTEMNDPEVISLGVGEPDFDTPWHIREEGIYSLERGRTFYTSNSGLKDLRNEISAYLKRRCQVEYDPEKEIMVTVGGSEAIDIGLRAVLNPGEEVIIPQPSYVSYEPCTILAGGTPVIINLQEKNEFRLTREELLEAITPKTKVLILPFPNNPTGSVMRREDLEAIAEVCIEKDILVMSDEIYSELTYGAEHVTIASLPGMRERTILINGFSKAYAMTGWRLGYACAPKIILEQMLKIHQFAIMCAPTTSQYAAVEALKNGDKDVKQMKESYNQRRRFLVHTFRKMGLKCFEPFGAFYVFPSIKELGMTSDEFAMELLKREKVAVVPGTAFGSCGEGFLRISYAYSLEELKHATDRLARFVEEIRKEKGLI